MDTLRAASTRRNLNLSAATWCFIHQSRRDKQSLQKAPYQDGHVGCYFEATALLRVREGVLSNTDFNDCSS